MNARTNVQTSVWERMLPYAMPLLLLVAFALRMVFVSGPGFTTDVTTFEAWTMSLLDNGLANFYAKTGFVDYPPGYFYILAIFGHLWAPFRAHDAGFTLLHTVVKLPGILADLGVGWLIYAVGRRFATQAVALGAAAVYLLNPATINNSAYYGQVDSVSAGFALLAAYLLLKSDDQPVGRLSWLIPAGWVSLAYSLLIKPQPAVLIVLFLAFAFADRGRMRERLTVTAIGIVAALVFSFVMVLPFHPTANPVDAFRWLLERYAFGSSQYDYNSVNAFNLWAIRQEMWTHDNVLIGWGPLQFPQYVWGIALDVAALGLVVWRYLQERTSAAFLESCTIALLAFYILSTRMHERYSFDALAFCIACIPIARRYLWGALALSIVLFANQIYALQFLSVVTNHTPGVDSRDLWGPLNGFYSVIAVGTFFALGYVFLGSVPETAAKGKETEAEEGARRVRDYYDPREGLSIMTVVDYAVMSVLGVVSFVLSFIRYWYPKDKIFDEIYFARAAEEYLKNMRIYENTHPPLTKLLVTVSVLLAKLLATVPLFHWLGNGDNSWGWRFGDVLFGALVVMLLYLFAKRVTGSTIFASIAAFFLLCDGMHFAQSRIGTPEGFVVVFSLGAVYAFYRFWIASQVESRSHTVVPGWGFAGAVIVSLAAGGLVVGIWDLIWRFAVHPPPGAVAQPLALDLSSSIIVTLYVALGVYLLLRYVLFRGWFADGAQEFTFPEGAYALVEGNNRALYVSDGGSIESTGGKPRINMGEVSQNRGGALVYPGDDYTLTYKADPSVTYETPVATATYVDNEIRAGDARERGKSATLWLIAFTIALGLLVSSDRLYR